MYSFVCSLSIFSKTRQIQLSISSFFLHWEGDGLSRQLPSQFDGSLLWTVGRIQESSIDSTPTETNTNKNMALLHFPRVFHSLEFFSPYSIYYHLWVLLFEDDSDSVSSRSTSPFGLCYIFTSEGLLSFREYPSHRWEWFLLIITLLLLLLFFFWFDETIWSLACVWQLSCGLSSWYENVSSFDLQYFLYGSYSCELLLLLSFVFCSFHQVFPYAFDLWLLLHWSPTDLYLSIL